MKPTTLLFPVLLVITVSSVSARAERAPDDRAKADLVVTGTVDAVFTRSAGRLTQYVVRVRLREVHKGKGYAKGEWLYVSCYQRRRGLAFADDLGHTAVPKEGQTLKAYVHRRDGRFEGNFPDWFEPVEPKEGASRP